MAQNYLTKVDFTKGVKAKPINDNFEMIQDWIDTERLQSAGWGVVSGFECSRRGDEFIMKNLLWMLADKLRYVFRYMLHLN